jgi:hypothetical protein
VQHQNIMTSRAIHALSRSLVYQSIVDSESHGALRLH